MNIPENMTREEANKFLSEALEEVKSKLQFCQDVADKYHLEFDSPIEKYGMGGTYVGEGFNKAEYEDESWSSSNEGQWVSSSEGC